jgi:putative endonuclease
MKYFVYVLRSVPTGRHYIGMTADPERRLAEHNTKSKRWTSAFKPWEVVVAEEYEDRRSACAREAFLKSRQGIGERRELISRVEQHRGAGRAQLVERP